MARAAYHSGSDHIADRCTCSPCTEPVVGLDREPAYRSHAQPCGAFRSACLPRTGASVVDSMDRRRWAREVTRQATYHRDMDTPDAPDAETRLAAIRATGGSADDIFDPDYMERLRQDWPD